MCQHEELIGKTGYHTCSCGQRFTLSKAEIIGSSRRKVPYTATRAIPVNLWGWYIGDGILLD